MSKKSDVGYFSDSRLRALSITAIALTDIQTIPINTFTSFFPYPLVNALFDILDINIVDYIGR